MPNYAMSGGGYSQAPFLQAAQGLPNSARIGFDLDPSSAYEYWLKFLSPTLADDRALRQLYSTLQTRYAADVNAGGPDASGYRWIDFLGNLDPSRELARLSPAQRGMDNQRRFSGPARYAAF